jgi:geranylgeranyl reductase family protein
MIENAIVGGGPAGSYCALCLAQNGIYPVIFDHTHPREKPCGGLVSPLAQKLFSFLEKPSIDHSEKSIIRLISPTGREVRLSNVRALCFSRLKLDQFLLNMAVDEGAELIKEKVIGLERKEDSWKVKTASRFYHVRILIGADGVNSVVRTSIVGPLSKTDKGVCCGYLAKGLEKEDITFKFLAHRKGYLWVIPRDDHTSLGIWASEASRSYGLRQELNTFIERQYPNAKLISEWAALIPNVKNIGTFQIPVAGSRWILTGDAAGHVSPTFGEGILYALLDGELAAQAVVENNPKAFNESWKKVYGMELVMNTKVRKWLYTRLGLEIYCKFAKLQNALFH